jgi:hypothetical protein
MKRRPVVAEVALAGERFSVAEPAAQILQPISQSDTVATPSLGEFFRLSWYGRSR